MSKKASSAVNQQETHYLLLRESNGDPQRLYARLLSTWTKKELATYLLGAMHDATLSTKGNVRFSQKGKRWLKVLKRIFAALCCKSWIYREGEDRKVYVLETTADFLDFDFDPIKLDTRNQKKCYIRGFFDAEGGIPQNKEARFYIQLAQKDRQKIVRLKEMLGDLEIQAGKVHNPSKANNPRYWRIYILADFQEVFVKKISSWHPRKFRLFEERVKI